MSVTSEQQVKDVVAVDDDELSLELIRRHLRNTPHRLNAFSNTDRALEFLLENAPTVLLIDQRMPKIDGLDFLRSLSASGRLGGTKTFLCSAVALPESVRSEAMELGAIPMIKDTLSRRQSFLEAAELA